MKTRPWPLIILAIAHLLAPVSNAILSAHLQHTPLLVYLQRSTRGPEIFQSGFMIAIFFIAAASIYLMKRWSYAVYLVSMGLVTYFNIQAAREYPHLYSIALSLPLAVFDLLIVGYFLIPEVRAGYFNPRLRWWESKPRYEVNAPIALSTNWNQGDATLVNIAEGGAFVRTPVRLEKEDPVEMTIQILSHNVRASGKVVHCSSVGYGIHFDLDRKTRREISALVKNLRGHGYEDKRTARPTLADFRAWLHRLVTTGKGWVPEIPAKRPLMRLIHGGQSGKSRNDSRSKKSKKAA